MKRKPLIAGLGSLLTAATIAACHPQATAPQAPAVAAASRLTVEVRLPGAARRVAAIAEDVARLAVRVTAVDGSVYEREFSRAQFGGYALATTFTAIPAGRLQLKAIAYDAQDRPIGLGLVETSLDAGASTTVALPVGLEAETRLGEFALTAGQAPALPPTTVAARNDALGGALTVAADGSVWLKQQDKLHKLGPDARAIATLTGFNAYVPAPVIDAAGHLWEMNGGLREYGPDGALLNQHLGLAGEVRHSRDGHLWLIDLPVVHKVTKAGAVLTTTTLPQSDAIAWTARVSSAGRLWVASQLADTTLRQLDESGRILSGTRPRESLFDLDVTPMSDYERRFAFAVDAGGHAWIGSYWSGKIAKVAPDGAVVGEYPACPLPSAAAVDGTGHVWVGGEARTLVKLSADGALVGTLSLDGTIRQLETDGNGDVWVVTEAPAAVYRLAP